MQIRLVYVLLLAALIGAGIAFSMAGGQDSTVMGLDDSPAISNDFFADEDGEFRRSRRFDDRFEERRRLPVPILLFGAFLAGAFTFWLLGSLFRRKPKPAEDEAPRRSGGVMNRMIVPGAGGIAAVSSTWEIQQTVLDYAGPMVWVASLAVTALVGTALATAGFRF